VNFLIKNILDFLYFITAAVYLTCQFVLHVLVLPDVKDQVVWSGCWGTCPVHGQWKRFQV